MPLLFTPMQRDVNVDIQGLEISVVPGKFNKLGIEVDDGQASASLEAARRLALSTATMR